MLLLALGGGAPGGSLWAQPSPDPSAREVAAREQALAGYLHEGGRHAPRHERIATRRALARALLAVAPEHPLALMEMARLSLDELQWNVYRHRRYRTGYFTRKVEAADRQTVAYLERLLRRAPDRPSTYRVAMQYVVYTGQYEAVAPVLGVMREHRADDPWTWLYLGTTAHRQNAPARAERFFSQALALAPPVLKEPLEATARWFGPPGDPGRARAGGWIAPDPFLLTAANERRNAHLARMVEAELLFGNPEEGLAGWDTVPGELWVRYGRPADPMWAASPYGVVLAGNEGVGKAWVYDVGTFYLEDPFRNGAYRLYTPPATAGREDPELEARALIRKTPQRYRGPARRYAMPRVTAAFKGEADSVDLYVAYGLARTGAEQQEAALPARRIAGAFLIDSTGVRARRVQRQPALPQGTAGGLEALPAGRAVVRLRAAPGAYTLALEVAREGQGVLAWERAAYEVPSLAGFALSDLVLAEAVEPVEEDARGQARGSWIRRDDWWVRPYLVDSLGSSAPLALYFEVYGLTLAPDGRRAYTVEVMLLREKKKKRRGVAGWISGLFGRSAKPTVALRFSRVAAAEDEAEALHFDASRAEPGRYALVLRVTDEVTGAVRETRCQVYFLPPS